MSSISKFADIAEDVDKELEPLTSGDEIPLDILSIPLDQLRKWSKSLSGHEGLLFARRVVPPLFLYLRSLCKDSELNFAQWVFEMAGRGNDEIADHRFLVIQALHEIIPRHLRERAPHPLRPPILSHSLCHPPLDWSCFLISSTFSTLTLALALDQDIVLDIAMYWAEFVGALTWVCKKYQSLAVLTWWKEYSRKHIERMEKAPLPDKLREKLLRVMKYGGWGDDVAYEESNRENMFKWAEASGSRR